MAAAGSSSGSGGSSSTVRSARVDDSSGVGESKAVCGGLTYAMKTRVLIFSFVLLFCSPLFARDNTDVIVMKNGDRMTCEIKGLSAGVLSVSLSYAQGTIGVQWSAVACWIIVGLATSQRRPENDTASAPIRIELSRRLGPKIRKEDIHADHEHPRRKDQLSPGETPDADEQQQRQRVA
jgi:hypothetical protein